MHYFVILSMRNSYNLFAEHQQQHQQRFELGAVY
jgi:hypothetical protein